MAEPLAPTWATRELPILRAALRRIDAGEDLPTLEDIRAEAGLDVVQMRAGLMALDGAWPAYLEVTHYLGGAGVVGGHVSAVRERARRELGTWPSAEALVDRLGAAFAQAADNETDPQRKSLLRTGGEAVALFGRDVAVGVIAAQLGSR